MASDSWASCEWAIFFKISSLACLSWVAQWLARFAFPSNPFIKWDARAESNVSYTQWVSEKQGTLLTHWSLSTCNALSAHYVVVHIICYWVAICLLVWALASYVTHHHEAIIATALLLLSQCVASHESALWLHCYHFARERKLHLVAWLAQHLWVFPAETSNYKMHSNHKKMKESVLLLMTSKRSW